MIKRPKSINAAAIIELIAAILSVFIGFVLMLANVASKGVAEPPKTLDGTFMAKYGLLFSAGLLVWGVISFIVWFGLRRLKRWGGILGIAECIAAIIVVIFIPYLRDVVTILINILMIILISAGWRSLR
ncbi:MAG: hypothetical protein Q8N14_04800 [Candidatus Omnitrophota bacterium]|nr:hypothetical protein [Candidatus Omnitrophota bacterium]